MGSTKLAQQIGPTRWFYYSYNVIQPTEKQVSLINRSIEHDPITILSTTKNVSYAFPNYCFAYQKQVSLSLGSPFLYITCTAAVVFGFFIFRRFPAFLVLSGTTSSSS